jgi:hypothetical protein
MELLNAYHVKALSEKPFAVPLTHLRGSNFIRHRAPNASATLEEYVVTMRYL